MVTREQVLVKAHELSVTLTEEQIQKHITDGTLPEETSEHRWLKQKAELEKLDKDKLIDKIADAQSEAKDHRLKYKEAREQFVESQRTLTELQSKVSKIPELESESKKAKETLDKMVEAERRRRVAVMSKIPEEKRAKLDYLLSVDSVSAEQFDGTVELLIEQKTPGATTPPPGGGGNGQVNPWKKETYSLTEQARIQKTDPSLANKLKEEARKR